MENTILKIIAKIIAFILLAAGCISAMEYKVASGQSSVTLQVFNPRPIGNGYKITEYELGK